MKTTTKILGILTLGMASFAVQAVEVASGSVACRTRAALEILRQAGGIENMSEHFRGITCFQLARPIKGTIVSRDDTGVLEVRLNNRRNMRDPARLYIDETVNVAAPAAAVAKG